MVWQSYLKSRGYIVGELDGDFGNKTFIATREFQRWANLTDDGIVGPGTLAAAEKLGFTGFPVPKPAEPVGPVAVDPKDLAKLDRVHPTLKRKATALINMAAAEGHTLRVVQGLRTFLEQDALANQPHDHKDNDGDGRVDEADENVTGAKGGQSNHNYGLAIDFVFIVDGRPSWDNDSLYRLIGVWAAACGLGWGGNLWKKRVDMPHVELPNCPNWRVLLSWYNAGGIDAVWKHFE